MTPEYAEQIRTLISELRITQRERDNERAARVKMTEERDDERATNAALVEENAALVRATRATVDGFHHIARLVPNPFLEIRDGRTLESAQRRALSTAIYPGQGTPMGFVYAVMGANGEAGELAEHAKKMLRDDASVLTETRRAAVLKELGDLFWYVCATAREAGYTLQEVADKNAEKLTKRKEAGTLQGSGSDR